MPLAHESHAPLRLLTPRNLLLFLAVFGLLIGGILRNPMVIFAGLGGLVAMLQGFLRARHLLETVSARREHPPRSFEGQEISVDLRLRTRSRDPLSLVLVEDFFPPASASRIRQLLDQPMQSDRELGLHYHSRCDHRRGVYAIGPVELSATDPLGLFKRWVRIEEVTTLVVYPQSVELESLQVLREGVLAHTGIELTLRGGHSEEFRGIREFRRGDAPGDIHWPSTARHGELMVREFMQEIRTELTLCLDLGKLGLTGLGDQTSIEYSIKAAASIARRAIARHHAVQMLAFADKVDVVPFGTGTTHLLNLLDRLAVLRAQGDRPFLDSVAKLLPTLHPGGTIALLFAASAVDPAELEALVLAALAQRVHPILVMIDDRAFIKIYHEQESRHALAPEVEKLARQLVFRGAEVHIIRKERSLERALITGLDLAVTA